MDHFIVNCLAPGPGPDAHSPKGKGQGKGNDKGNGKGSSSSVTRSPGLGSPPSVMPWFILCLCTAPFFFANLDDPFQLRATVLIAVNIAVRLYFPSSYYPATAVQSGWIASPISARLIAFLAEFGLYEIWTMWSGISFWGTENYLWLLVLFGECVSSIGLLRQSEYLFFIEDTIWAIHTTYMAILNYPNSDSKKIQILFFGAFAVHMWFFHLPKRFKLMNSRGNKTKEELNTKRDEHAPKSSSYSSSSSSSSSPSTSAYFILTPSSVALAPCPLEEKLWVVPMLVSQSILTSLMFKVINEKPLV